MMVMMMAEALDAHRRRRFCRGDKTSGVFR
jgi:hypothetical protein